MPDPSTQPVQWQRFGRHASRDFLMAGPRGRPHKSHYQAPPDGQVALLRRLYPDLKVDGDLTADIENQMDHAPGFGLIVLKPDADKTLATDDQLAALGRNLSELASEHQGLWGLLKRDVLAIVLPNAHADACLNQATAIQQGLTAEDLGQITAGIALYPTDHYRPGQVADNALKALDHAGFFGPGGIVAFDAVSLNISADRLYNDGDIAGAINEFTIATRLDPANANVFNSLGVCYGVMGNYPQALEAFRMAITLDAKEGIAHYNYGLVQLLLGDLETALTYFKDAKARQRDIFEVSLQLGRLFIQRGQWSEALTHLDEAVSLNAGAGLAHRLQGDCHVQNGNWSTAKRSYTQAIRINPEDAAALSALAAIYGRLGENLELAEIFALQSIDLAPEKGLYHQRLGNLHQRNGDAESARRAFERATALGVNGPDAIWDEPPRTDAAV